MRKKDDECCRCHQDDNLWAYDGERWLCWDCAEKAKFNLSSFPTADAFAKLAKDRKADK